MKDYITVADRMKNLDEIEYIREAIGRRVERQMNILIAVSAIVSIVAILLS